jgi:hypothetical protein
MGGEFVKYPDFKLLCSQLGRKWYPSFPIRKTGILEHLAGCLGNI